jgi:hypothetical protein
MALMCLITVSILLFYDTILTVTIQVRSDAGNFRFYCILRGSSVLVFFSRLIGSVVSLCLGRVGIFFLIHVDIYR